MKAVFRSLFVTVAVSAATPALAQDISGTWNVAVRESGRNNYYLPMTDGRLEIADGGRTARFRNLAFTGTAAADGLHLACLSGGLFQR